MAKRIAICFDGTWNTPDNKGDLDHLERTDHRDEIWFERVNKNAGVETNVCRLYRSVLTISPGDAKDGIAQIKWYDKGVGTEWYDRISGGAFGTGLSRKIREGYKFLSSNYDDGDEIFVFGFSRGAYTARSLVGMIRNCGLLPPASLQLDQPDDNLHLLEAYEIYRTRDKDADSMRALTFRRKYGARLIDIKFLGVWDTVGALGIPIESFGEFNKEQFEFHDTELSGIVKNAYHAIAVDEHRKPYAATLWDPKTKPDQTIEQRWFIGAHADVGGGYPSRKLSDLTIEMAAREGAGLRLGARSSGYSGTGGRRLAWFDC